MTTPGTKKTSTKTCSKVVKIHWLGLRDQIYTASNND